MIEYAQILGELLMKQFATETEIFEFAIARECQSQKLFTILMEKIQSAEMKEIFAQLAAEEVDHRAKLELELMKLGVIVKNAQEPVLDEAFLGKEFKISDELDYADVLRICIQKEREAFRMYIDLSHVVHEPAAREILLGLAEEEARHKARFEVEMDKVAKERG